MAGIDGPLKGVTVIDLTAGIAGPYATFLLAGMGARVIKIEKPVAEGEPFPNRQSPPFIGRDGVSMVKRHDDDVSIASMHRLRGLESITLDLKKPGARQVFLDLAAKAEVVFENLSRGAATRSGVGYADAAAVNPSVVYTSLSGTGQADTTGSGKTIDTVIQAMSGFMMTSGNEGEPPMRNGVPIADLITPLYAVIGTLAALTEARATGKGQHVDVSMLGALTTLIANDHFPELQDMGFPVRTGPTVPRIAPLGVYPSADGHVAICTVSDDRFRALTQTMGQPELATDERFATRPARIKHAAEIDAIVGAWTATLPAEQAAEALDRAGVPSGPVRTMREALRDPRVLDQGVVPLAHPKYGATHEIHGPGIPIKFGGRSYPHGLNAPDHGEHNDAVYGGLLGYGADKLAELKAAGAI
jgi:CoA:oxalate CoA-transferase